MNAVRAKQTFAALLEIEANKCAFSICIQRKYYTRKGIINLLTIPRIFLPLLCPFY